MIMGAAASTVYYNIRLRHPTLSMPIIDYDLALLFQPMLMLGISIGVAFNVLFADWMVTILLLIIFLVTSTKAFFRGVAAWKKETLFKKEAARILAQTVNEEAEGYIPLSSGPTNSRREQVSIFENICWSELGLLLLVWGTFLALQITKNYTSNCSISYWVLNSLQHYKFFRGKKNIQQNIPNIASNSKIPVAVAVTMHEAVNLYKGEKKIQSKGDEGTNWRAFQLILYCLIGILAGIVGGLLGLGGGFILGPLFLELGVPPQVSSATATFIMTFSASMYVIEYYLLKRFPVPYALYFSVVAIISALIGQKAVGKLIKILGRASLIIFILAFTIFFSAVSLGGTGIFNMIGKMERHEYMGFENLCKQH
ncbi:Sulfite exporter TauE/SafE family protein [Rhynchospora pubera]|uniref:Sulfite exporter TauE/SafE family protein n=1 Tax=Rhynchospora pubera TaxID=906938 RepID=A0AAV8DA08_9POAL|nr:Sulfite exporter TauE/SafE family protein [Rhynchospora pubera]